MGGGGGITAENWVRPFKVKRAAAWAQAGIAGKRCAWRRAMLCALRCARLKAGTAWRATCAPLAAPPSRVSPLRCWKRCQVGRGRCERVWAARRARPHACCMLHALCRVLPPAGPYAVSRRQCLSPIALAWGTAHLGCWHLRPPLAWPRCAACRQCPGAGHAWRRSAGHLQQETHKAAVGCKGSARATCRPLAGHLKDRSSAKQLVWGHTAQLQGRRSSHPIHCQPSLPALQNHYPPFLLSWPDCESSGAQGCMALSRTAVYSARTAASSSDLRRGEHRRPC